LYKKGEMMEKKRSVGIIIIVLGIVNLILGIVGILSVIVGIKMRFFPSYDAAKGYAFDIHFGGLFLVAGIIFSLFLLVGICTLRQRPVGRILNLILSPITGCVISLPFIKIFGNISVYIFIPVGIIAIIYFFTRSKVKEQFK
jgi:hypothetical protein